MHRHSPVTENRISRGSVCLLAVWIGCGGAVKSSEAQQRLWDLSHYVIRVRLAIEAPGQLDDQLNVLLPTFIQERVASTIGPLWRLEIETVAGSERQQMLRDLASLTQAPPTPITEHEDKHILIVVRWLGGGFELSGCEYDWYVERWGRVLTEFCPQYAGLGECTFSFLQRTFAPLARFQVDAEQEDFVRLYLRGARVPEMAEPVSWVQPGDVFLPILRRTTRDGELVENGIQEVPWTVLAVEQTGESGVLARTQSGARRPFGVRRRGRVEQVAIAMRGDPAPMTVRLVSRSQPSKALVGYAAFAQDPRDKSLTPLGYTDRTGRLLVPPTTHPVRLLVLKSGEQLLARLPVVPGPQLSVEIPLPDDDPRLQAEAKLLALREQLIDLVARRSILMARVRRLIEQEQFDRATSLFEELDALPGQTQFSRELSRQEQLHHSDDPQIQRRIDKLFADTKVLLGHFLDTREINQLRDELTAARSSSTG